MLSKLSGLPVIKTAEQNLIDNFAEVLYKRDFDHFVTFTTKNPTTLQSMRRSLTRFANAFSAGIQYNQARNQFGIDFFWAAEPFALQNSTLYDHVEGSQLMDQKTERYHAHGLIKDSLTFSKKDYIHNWSIHRQLGYLDVLPISENKSAHYYCAKYIRKNISDYDIRFKQKINDKQETRRRIENPFSKPETTKCDIKRSTEAGQKGVIHIKGEDSRY